MGDNVRSWPVSIVSYPHWEEDYAKAARETGVGLSIWKKPLSA